MPSTYRTMGHVSSCCLVIEDIAAHWGSQRTSGATAEKGEQNKLGNYPPNNKSKIWANADSKSDYVSQWTLEGPLLMLGWMRLTAFQKY